jgi:hypothetical protein
VDAEVTRAETLWRWLARASLVALALWAALFAFVLATRGLEVFEHLSPNGRAFWILQSTLALGAFGTSFPLARRWVSWLAALRLLLALGLLVTLAGLWGVTQPMRY